jgi:cytoskeletal protein CcmA (bactofilin family)
MSVNTISKSFSIIDQDLTVEGLVSCKGKLVIKGTVKGTLNGDVVVIAKEGAVYAKATLASMTVAGMFEGDIEASEELVILSTGTCSGNVVCKHLVVEANGKLKADVVSISKRDTVSEGDLVQES